MLCYSLHSVFWSTVFAEQKLANSRYVTYRLWKGIKLQHEMHAKGKANTKAIYMNEAIEGSMSSPV